MHAHEYSELTVRMQRACAQDRMLAACGFSDGRSGRKCSRGAIGGSGGNAGRTASMGGSTAAVGRSWAWCCTSAVGACLGIGDERVAFLGAACHSRAEAYHDVCDEA